MSAPINKKLDIIRPFVYNISNKKTRRQLYEPP